MKKLLIVAWLSFVVSVSVFFFINGARILLSGLNIGGGQTVTPLP